MCFKAQKVHQIYMNVNLSKVKAHLFINKGNFVQLTVDYVDHFQIGGLLKFDNWLTLTGRQRVVPQIPIFYKVCGWLPFT